MRLFLAIMLTTTSFCEMFGFPATQADDAQSTLKILNGWPTRLFFTGNPHHPTFGKEKLAQLLQRHFDGKSPVRVDGIADARKDPLTQKPIPPAKISELIRFLEPEFKAERTEGERFVVIVEEPRTKKSPT